MDATDYTTRSNANRAAQQLLKRGTAPATEFEIQPTDEGKFAVVWKTARRRRSNKAEPDMPEHRDDAVKGIFEKNPVATPTAERETIAAEPVAAEPKVRRSKQAELDASAAAGVMPEKPVITSPTNQHYQKHLDRLAELAAAGDRAAIAAFEVKGSNTYAKLVARYRDRLVAAFQAGG